MDEARPAAERDYVLEYAARAPLALALERALESRLLARYRLRRPVLDLGCGDGLFVEVTFGSRVGIDYGIDSDASECERARARGVYNEVFNASAVSIPLPDGAVSTVMSNSTLEHLQQLPSVLREAARVLTDGGELYATVPTDRFDRYAVMYRFLRRLGLVGWAESFRRSYNRFWRHHHYYAPDGWRRLVEEHGFRVAETIEYDSPSRCALHDALVPFAFPAFVIKKLTGRYVLVPPIRRGIIRLVRRMLPDDRTDDLPGTGGLVLVRAVKR